MAKFYVSEAHSDAVRSRLASEDAVLFSEIAKAELAGAFHRRFREGKWGEREFQANLRQFLRDDASGYWTCLPLETKIVEESLKTYATLPKRIFLRTADCLHLVTALHHGFDQICTHDVHQQRAAQALGLQAVTIQ